MKHKIPLLLSLALPLITQHAKAVPCLDMEGCWQGCTKAFEDLFHCCFPRAETPSSSVTLSSANSFSSISAASSPSSLLTPSQNEWSSISTADTTSLLTSSNNTASISSSYSSVGSSFETNPITGLSDSWGYVTHDEDPLETYLSQRVTLTRKEYDGLTDLNFKENCNYPCPVGKLTNNGQDCSINSSLQLLKALRLQAPPNMPYLKAFLQGYINDDNGCRRLRNEIATMVLTPSQDFDVPEEFHDFVINGVAEQTQDAAAFLRLLLKKANAPELLLQETLPSSISSTSQPTYTSEPLLHLSFPPIETPSSYQNSGSNNEYHRALTTQDLINYYFHSTVEGYCWVEDSSSIIKKIELCEPTPETLVISLGRCSFSNGKSSKNEEPISNLSENITLPVVNSKRVVYQPIAFICHDNSTNKSINTGHYLAYVLENKAFHIYDDDKPGNKLPERYKTSHWAEKNCYIIAYRKVASH